VTILLDLVDRKMLDWTLSETIEVSKTTIPALLMAVKSREVTDSLIFHSYRGFLYPCNEFRRQLNDSCVAQSMSRKGNCWDNVVAESFFKTMKTEMVYHESFQTKS
jgi:putative transposase